MPESRSLAVPAAAPLVGVPTGQANRASRSPDDQASGRPRGQPGRARHAAPGHMWRRVLDRTEKREFVASLAAVFAETSGVVVTLNEGLTVAEVTTLRRRMRDAGATFKVAKNRLATLALDGTRVRGHQAAAEGADRAGLVDGPGGRGEDGRRVRQDQRQVRRASVVRLAARRSMRLASRRLPSCRRWRRCAPGCWGCSSPRDPDRRRPPGAGRTARTGACGLCQEGEQERGRPERHARPAIGTYVPAPA